MKKAEEFEEWFNTTFLFSRDSTSIMLNSDNKTMKAKYARICKVSKMIINNPDEDTEILREEVAMLFLVSMRCALDYINYAKLVLKKWENRKL